MNTPPPAIHGTAIDRLNSIIERLDTMSLGRLQHETDLCVLATWLGWHIGYEHEDYHWLWKLGFASTVTLI